MPIEGIIEGLRECSERHSADQSLKDYIKDAIEALSNIEDRLEEAYQEGKRACIEEMVVGMLD